MQDHVYLFNFFKTRFSDISVIRKNVMKKAWDGFC